MDVHQKDSVMNKSVLDIDPIELKNEHDVDYEEDFEEINLEQELDMDEFDNSPIQHVQEPPSKLGKKHHVLPMKNLNLGGIKGQDFHEEFMDNYDEFSQSWRDQIDREKTKTN